MTRIDGRSNEALRPVSIQLGAQRYAEGSALISAGDTRVLCAASVEERVPEFLRGSGRGWVTAEYAMLPRATHTRNRRQFPPKGRAQEIQRLIGRSLRAAVDMETLGERTITVDCDVIQADGGTRTAAITGAYPALRQALAAMGAPPESVRCAVAAVSVGADGCLRRSIGRASSRPPSAWARSRARRCSTYATTKTAAPTRTSTSL